MEKFTNVTDKFIERVELLKAQVSTKVSAKEIVYGTSNKSIECTQKYALLTDNQGKEYWSNAIFAIQRGLIPKLDEVFEENLDKVKKGNFNLRLFFSEEHDVENKVISKLLDTKISSEKATSFVNSHYFRFFKENGIAFFRAGEKNTAIMFNGAGEFAGLLIGLRTPGNFEGEITLEKFNEELKLLKDFKAHHKNELIKNIVEAKKDNVILKITELNDKHKDSLDGDLHVFKNIYGYYDIGYKLKKPIMAYVKEISVFSSSTTTQGYNEYIRDGKHFGGPRQKISKAISKELATAMYNEFISKGVNNVIEECNDTKTKNFEIFKSELSLLEAVTNTIVDSLGKNPLNELSFYVNNVFKYDNKASVDIRMFSYKYHFRIFVEGENFILNNVDNGLTVIKECMSKEEVLETITSITKQETKEREERKLAIDAIREFTYRQPKLIIDTGEERYVATEHSYQAINRGRLYGSTLNYMGSREEYIYNLYKEGKLDSLKLTDGSSLSKSFLDKLPAILIKDIIANFKRTQEEENIEMKMLFNLQNASNENELLQVLGDILMQENTEITSDTILADFFTKADDLGKELHKLIDKLVDKVLDDTENSTEEEMWLLKGYGNAIPDLSKEVSEKIELAILIRDSKKGLNKCDTSNKESTVSPAEDTSNTQSSPVTSEEIVEVERVKECEIADNLNNVTTNDDGESVEHSNEKENESASKVTEEVTNITSQATEAQSDDIDTNYIDEEIKVSLNNIIDTVNQLEWSIVELFHSKNTIKAAINNKYNNRRVVGLYAGIEDNSSKQIAQLLSNHYSKPVYTTN